MATTKKKITLKVKTKQSKKENKKEHKKKNTKKEDKNDTKKKNKTDHKYTKYYPSILDPNFSNKIANHSIFKRYKLNTDPVKLKSLYNAFETNKSSALSSTDEYKKKMVYILKPTQKLLRNFMSPYTPYRGLLIYHEMGVGKTCTAITIAEVLKSIVKNSKTKIYVIRPDEIVRQVFDINTVRNGKPLYQCTGDTYIQNPNLQELVENCSIKGNEQSCDQLNTKVEKEIKQIYEFTGSKSWAYSILKEINAKTKGIQNEKEKEDKKKQIISKKFNNSVIIVDEAHELHSNESQTKIVPPVLNMVLKYSSNLRLIFLTATPIYDKPNNIISIINYFLINDKRAPLKQNDIFDINDNLKEGGREILENNTRGYVSYLRGNNPYEFPIRLSAKYNIPDQMLNLNNYPKKDIYDKRIDKQNKIKYLELVDCPLQNQQLDILNYHIKTNKIPDLSENDFDKYTDDEEEYFEIPLTDDDSSTIFDFEARKNKSNLIENVLDKKIKLKSKSKQKITLKSKKTAIKLSKKSTKNSTKQSNNSNKIDNIDNIDDFKIVPTKAVAYQLERQLSNFVYQSLEESNKNVKFTSGTNGLNQIAKKHHGKWTYEFNDPEYGKRFKLPELYNWGAKIAKVVERVIASTGRVFIYTGFIDSGIIPIAFALEMNGYRRYKQSNTPILENKYKDQTYRGDYIIYTGTQSQSLFAKEYLDKGSSMIKETNVKVFIGTSKASQGLNLFGYREVHIVDPWHNINLTEQSIGRVIRTGSHLHLPPQERNVTVYQYATTMGDRESFDLKIYKICENKAIKSGIIEKILKENAFDCELNKDVNFYDVKTYGNKIPLITSNNKKIMVSLADAEYTRSCFYMKDCNFKCNVGNSDNSSNNYNNVPIIKFNYEKDVEEYKNLIRQLIQSSLNLKIDNLKQYLLNMNKSINIDEDEEEKEDKENKEDKEDKEEKENKKYLIKKEKDTSNLILDEEIFNTAIQDIINTDLIITDRLGRKGKIVLSGEYLRFIPEGNLDPNMSIQKQQMKQPNIFSQIDLKEYISLLDEKQKNVIEFEIKNYDDILSKSLFNKAEEIYYNVNEKEYVYNLKLKFEEILEIIFSKLLYSLKLIIIKTLLEKIVNDSDGNSNIKNKLTDNEKKLEKIVMNHVIYMKDVYPDAKQDINPIKNIYGFIIQNETKLELFHLNNNKLFEKTLGNLNKIIENKKHSMSKTPYAQLYGFLKYEKKNSEPVFKITDIISKGEKKSVRGLSCSSKTSSEIKKTLNKLDDKLIRSGIKHQSKIAFCNDAEVLFRRNDLIKKNGKKWFYSPEEHHIMFEYGNN